jgi:hypothetical protein
MTTHSLAATIVLLTVASLGAQTRPSIEGVWKISERVTPGGNARANGVAVRQTDPRPNVMIFTKGYYSEMIEMGVGPRPEVPEPADPRHLTDAEKVARYDQWRPFTANSGRYEIAGSVLIKHPLVAKNVEVMKRGTAIPLEIRVDSPNAVWLIPTGEFAKTEPRIKLTRVE